jgi:putative hemolysin
VTLHDAIEQVVGDILDPSDDDEAGYVKLNDTDYRLEGSISIDEFTELTGIALEDEEHETVAGFLMDLSEKVLEPGDVIQHPGVVFTVEAMDGKRVETLRAHIVPQPQEEAS